MPKLPESAVRFSDAQMRDEPELVAAAVRYARAYVGDWDVMRAARILVERTGTLPVAVARTVANCARSDPRYVLSVVDVQAGVQDLYGNVVPIRGGACPHLPHHLNDCCQKGGEAEVPDFPFPFQWPPTDPRHQHDYNAAGYCRNRTCHDEPEGQTLREPFRRMRRLRFKHRYYWSTHPGAYRVHILDPRESYGVWSPRGQVASYRIYGWCHATVSHWTTGNEPPAGRSTCLGCEKAEARAIYEVAAQVFVPQSNDVVNSSGQED